MLNTWTRSDKAFAAKNFLKILFRTKTPQKQKGKRLQPNKIFIFRNVVKKDDKTYLYLPRKRNGEEALPKGFLRNEFWTMKGNHV